MPIKSQILWTCLVLNSLGGNNDLRTLRIPGVLQRFGFAYLIVGLIQAIFANRELPSLSEQHVEENTIPWWWPARDIKVRFKDILSKTGLPGSPACPWQSDFQTNPTHLCTSRACELKGH